VIENMERETGLEPATEKGFISFAARESRKHSEQADRRESDETVQ